MLTGLTVSSGLGEQRFAPDLRVEVETAHVRASSFACASAKAKSGAGWVAGGDVDVALGRGFFAGGAFHRRNGGPWTKDSVWLRGGFRERRVQLLLRHDVSSINRIGIAELTVHQRLGRIRYENTAALVRFRRADGTIGWGVYAQVAVGLRAAGDVVSSRRPVAAP